MCPCQEPHAVHASQSHFLKIYLNVNLPSGVGPTSGLFALGFHTKTPYTPLLPMRATCPAHFIHLDLIIQIICGEEYSSLNSSLCSFPHSPVTSLLLDPNSFLNTLFYNTLSLRPSLTVSDQVCHSNKRTSKIIVLCILIFIFLESTLEKRERFCTDW